MSAACDAGGETGKPGCCVGVQAGSGRRPGALLGVGRGASSLHLRSFLINESIATETEKLELVTNDGPNQTEQHARYDLEVVGRREHGGGGRDEGKGRTGYAREGGILNYKWGGKWRRPTGWLSFLPLTEFFGRRTGGYMMSFARPGVSPTDVRGARGRLTRLDTRLDSHCISPRVGRDRRPWAGGSVSFL